MNLIKNISKSEVHVLKDQVTYQEGQVVSKTLAQNDAVSITLFAFDKDEAISTCRLWCRTVQDAVSCCILIILILKTEKPPSRESRSQSDDFFSFFYSIYRQISIIALH